MSPEEVEALRKAADEVWEIARRLERQGMYEAAEELKEAATALHDRARLSSLPPKH